MLSISSFYNNIPERRSKVLIQKFPQPSATLFLDFVAGRFKFGGHGFFIDGKYYLSWAKFTEEIQFTHFLGSERQSALHPGHMKEQFHPSHVFRLAGIIGLPAIVNVTPPDPSTQIDVKCQNECSVSGPPASDAIVTNVSTHTVGLPALTSEIQNLPHFSPLKAWYRESIFGSFANLPALIRSEQSTSKEGKRSELFRSVDLLCATLEKTNLHGPDASHGHENSGLVDSDFKQSPNGSNNQGGSSGGTQNSSGQKSQPAISRKPVSNRKQKGKRPNKNGSDNEGGHPSKKTKPDGPGQETGFQCRIYQKSGSHQLQSRCTGEKFPDFGSMRDHLLRIHIKPHQCEYCWKRFGRKSECKRHQDTICAQRGLVKRVEKSLNDVPDYVIEIGQQVSESTGIDDLDRVLYPNGQKRYDILDDTGVGRSIPEPNQEVPGHTDPPEPSSVTTHIISENTSNSIQELIGEGAIFSISGQHSSSYGNHVESLEDQLAHIQDLNQPFCFPATSPTGGPSPPPGQDGILTELNFLQSEAIMSEIENESDPSSFVRLGNKLLATFSPNVRDAIVAATTGGRVARSSTTRPVLDNDSLQMQNHPQNDFAQQVASGGDEIPVPPTEVSDSAFASTSTGPCPIVGEGLGGGAGFGWLSWSLGP